VEDLISTVHAVWKAYEAYTLAKYQRAEEAGQEAPEPIPEQGGLHLPVPELGAVAVLELAPKGGVLVKTLLKPEWSNGEVDE
jgi:hypothetical protein